MFRKKYLYEKILTILFHNICRINFVRCILYLVANINTRDTVISWTEEFENHQDYISDVQIGVRENSWCIYYAFITHTYAGFVKTFTVCKAGIKQNGWQQCVGCYSSQLHWDAENALICGNILRRKFHRDIRKENDSRVIMLRMITEPSCLPFRKLHYIHTYVHIRKTVWYNYRRNSRWLLVITGSWISRN